jgi:hypothetical protein
MGGRAALDGRDFVQSRAPFIRGFQTIIAAFAANDLPEIPPNQPTK